MDADKELSETLSLIADYGQAMAQGRFELAKELYAQIVVELFNTYSKGIL